jgi:ribonuclease P protein component
VQTLPPSARVRAKADFDRVFSRGRRLSDPLFGLHWLADDAPARLGLAVSRKVDSRAVGRNRIKRVLRAQFRALRAQLAPGAYVVVARSAAARAAPQMLRASLQSRLQRAGALPVSGTAGTMPPGPRSAPASLPS